ncbi:MAG TPA: hypothetical protein VGZ73_23235 [Bryobacteraceae bacterium]|jgi:hypothetical protein|nr:hypothetical protein [Bryobacteraceae bacterium]
MKTLCTILLCAAAVIPAIAQDATPCAGLPPGKHSLLERFTADFGLTCEQQLKVEPMLHDEESVSKPLLAFAAFTPEEQQAVMLKIKLAARRQVRTLLTPDQQKKMDGEIETTAKGGSKGGKKGVKKDAPKVDPFENEEALSRAVMNYAALHADEKTALVLQIKQAARRDHALELTAEQEKKIDADIQQLGRIR